MDEQTAMNIQEILYKVLHSSPIFKDAVKRALTSTLDKGLKYFRRFKEQIIKKCKERKEVIVALAKVASMSGAKYVLLNEGTKQAFKYGFAKAGSQGIKIVASYASIILGFTQTGTAKND